MVAFETLHSMQHNNYVKEGFMALKVDMSKVYDRMEWSILEVLMPIFNKGPNSRKSPTIREIRRKRRTKWLKKRGNKPSGLTWQD